MGTTSFDAERSRRPIADIDLAGVGEALGDNSGESRWWYDPASGQVELSVPDEYLLDDEQDDDPNERGLVPIEPIGSRDAYRDMAAFSNAVCDSRASDMLLRALEGRGAFRRFRDTLHELGDLREQWFVYSNATAECRAIDWLLDESFVASDDADAERAARGETIDGVVTEIGSRNDDVVDEADLVERWVEIRNLIDAGRQITIDRSGRRWATITPEADR